MSVKLAAALVAGGLGAEVVRRAFVKKSKIVKVPPQVSEHAFAELGTMRVAMPRKPPRDYTEAYIEQKRVLIAESSFPAETEYYCSSNLFGVCLPIPPKVIPVCARDRTREVVNEWLRVADSVRRSDAFSELEDLLGVHIVGLVGLMTGFGGIGSGDSRTPVDVNRRVWSHIGQIALCLQGVAINHGDIELEARKQLLKDVTDPKKYAEASGDLVGALLEVVADVAGAGVAKFLATNAGAIVIVGGAAYFVLRRSS